MFHPRSSSAPRTALSTVTHLAGSVGIALLVAAGACRSTPGDGTASGRSGEYVVSPEQREILDGYWLLYLRNDPAWLEARDAWLEMGVAARNALVDSLIRDLVVGTSRMQYERVDRASTELVRLGVMAVPDLLEAGRRGDGILRQQVSEILSLVGRPAVDAVIGSVERSGSGPFRRHEVEILGNIGDIRAYDTVRTVLFEEKDWTVRAAAASALGGFGDSRAIADLDEALRREKDPYVRERIADSLGNFPDTRSVVALIGAMEREESRGPMEGRGVIRACSRSLYRITGEDLADDARTWGNWWERNGRAWAASRDRDRGN
jgi:hypothetical protein